MIKSLKQKYKFMKLNDKVLYDDKNFKSEGVIVDFGADSNNNRTIIIKLDQPRIIGLSRLYKVEVSENDSYVTLI